MECQEYDQRLGLLTGNGDAADGYPSGRRIRPWPACQRSVSGVTPKSLPNRGHALSLDGELYSATIPLSELPTGLQRIEVHVSDQTGQT